MRTTLTLEPDVAALLRAAMQRDGASLKDTVNRAIRRGLTPGAGTADPPHRVRVHHAVLADGIDRRTLNRLADELEDEALLAAEPPR